MNLRALADQWEADRKGNGLRDEPAPRRQGLYRCMMPRYLTLPDPYRAGSEMVLKKPCGMCRYCAAQRTTDMVGRCLGEAYGCFEAQVFTLTYRNGPNGEVPAGALAPHPEHISMMVRKVRDHLRRKSYRRLRHVDRTGARHHRETWVPRIGADGRPVPETGVRYLFVYEYGEKSKRGHWHGILFFENKSQPASAEVYETDARSAMKANPRGPLYEVERRYLEQEQFRESIDDPDSLNLYGGRKYRQNWAFWPHGKVSVESITGREYRAPESAFAYVGKYMSVANDQKSLRTENIRPDGKHWIDPADFQNPHYQASPNLGWRYVKRWAERHVEQGLPLNDATYTFPGVYRQARKSDQRKALGEAWRKDLPFVPSGKRGARRVFEIRGVLRERVADWYRAAFFNRHPFTSETDKRQGEAVVSVFVKRAKQRAGPVEEREKGTAFELEIERLEKREARWRSAMEQVAGCELFVVHQTRSVWVHPDGTVWDWLGDPAAPPKELRRLETVGQLLLALGSAEGWLTRRDVLDVLADDRRLSLWTADRIIKGIEYRGFYASEPIETGPPVVDGRADRDGFHD